ncbi:MAG: hypothetical protein JXQ97_15695 [Natronospirillum sp.]
MRVEEVLSLGRAPKVHLTVVAGDGVDIDEIPTGAATARNVSTTVLTRDKIDQNNQLDEAEVILVNLNGFTDDDATLLKQTRAFAPETNILVATPVLNADATRLLLKQEVADWIPKPLNLDDLFDSIARNARKRRAHDNRAHAVISANGGAGATTLAMTMADLASQKLGKVAGSVALFDLDFAVGDAGHTLNMANTFNLASVTAAPQRVDEEFVRLIQMRHDNGFYLYSFKYPELTTELKGYELVLRMLDAVTSEHDNTFLDIPYYETDWKEDVLSAVNTYSVVTELHPPALKHALDVVNRIKKLRGEDAQIHLIINKWQSSLFGQRIGSKRIKELFGDLPVHYVPLSLQVVGEAADRGVPPTSLGMRSSYVKRALKYLKGLGLEKEGVTS